MSERILLTEITKKSTLIFEQIKQEDRATTNASQQMVLNKKFKNTKQRRENCAKTRVQ
jgi:hypothetical protein